MSVIDITSKLGEFMLKGWVLTDETCSRKGCSVPLLRSPRGQLPTTSFCANCDTYPISVNNAGGSSITKISEGSVYQSDPLSTIIAKSVNVTNNQALHRRQQSDAASAEMGRLLLKGWAMLADECPNAECYGIPLMRPPATGGQKDNRKECVVCRTTYVDEKISNVSQKNRGSSIIETADGLYSNNIATMKGNSHQGSIKEKPQHPSGTFDGIDNLSSVRSTGFLDSLQTSLESALRNLSNKLVTATADTSIVDPTSIGYNIDAIGKLVKILEDINRLQRTSTSW